MWRNNGASPFYGRIISMQTTRATHQLKATLETLYTL
jgi:hypothetical protein